MVKDSTILTRAITVILMVLLPLMAIGCGGGSSGGSTTKLVELEAVDEDYINFGTMEGFTYSTDWSIIERVQIPANADTFTGGWHYFRGSGWVDLEGDLAIGFTYGVSPGVQGWVRKGGWTMLKKDVALTKGGWYTICFQYDYANTRLELYVDGSAGYVSTTVSAMDDRSNTTPLYWGGQHVGVAYSYEGDLYSEEDITFAHQAWFQRILSDTEIDNYNGTVDNNDPDLFFSSMITDSLVDDASGNGHDGSNGNTPVYYSE